MKRKVEVRACCCDLFNIAAFTATYDFFSKKRNAQNKQTSPDAKQFPRFNLTF